jgi:hypothetical protein
MRGRWVRASTGPSGRNSPVSTPEGTSSIRDRGTPSSSNSRISSWHCTTTRSATRPSRRSYPMRWSGLVSAAPWCRRFTEPSAWKVCTTGTSTVRAAVTAASPLIQKCACATSGSQDERQSAASQSAKVPMCGSNSSLGRTFAGPAGTCTTSKPSIATMSGGCGSSRRV